MPEALILEFTGVTGAEYGAVNKHLGIDMHTGQGDWPAGLLSHAAGTADDGTFVVSEVWSSRADQDAFMTSRLEVIAVLGTTALFLACRGPARRVIARFGPRLGLTEARLRRAAAFAETRGRPGLALGRGTPGLRTLTVIAAGVSGLNGRRALPALILGSSVFLQLHLVLGLLLGPLADRAFDRAKGPALAAATALVAAGVIFWLVRRRRRATAPAAWMEASCPACIGVSLLAGRVPGLAGLAAPDPARPEPGDEPKVLVSEG